jgi:hypothetical protein
MGLDPTPPQLKSPEALEDPALAAAYKAWRALTGGRLAPARKEITPARFKAILPITFLCDVIEGGTDFRFVLGGDKLVRFLDNRIAPGMMLSTIEGSFFHARCVRIFRHAISVRTPIASGPHPTALPGREYLTLEVLVLPLSNDGETITGVFGGMHMAPMKESDYPFDPPDAA